MQDDVNNAITQHTQVNLPPRFTDYTPTSLILSSLLIDDVSQKVDYFFRVWSRNRKTSLFDLVVPISSSVLVMAYHLKYLILLCLFSYTADTYKIQ